MTIVRTIRRASALAVAALVLVLTACAGSPPAGAPPVEAPVGEHELTAEDVGSWLDGMLPSALTDGDVPGAVVAVVKDGQVLTTRGYGWADTGTDGGEPVPVDEASTLFRAGSVSKIVTSIAAMQLVEQGQLDLDADVATYLDFDFERSFDEPVTLRHLLTHTAGFENGARGTMAHGGGAFDLETHVKANTPAQVYAPGTMPAYSNYGLSLAGYIIQRVSGERFEDYVQGHVLDPAGMSSSTFDQPLPEDLADRMARGYPQPGQPAALFEVVESPAGALTTSAPDFAAFMTAQLERSPELLKEKTWEQMWAPGLGEDTLGGLARGDRMGLGYWTHQHNGHRVVGHGGDTTAFHSDFQIYPEDGVGVFIAMNGSGSGNARQTIRANLMDGFTDRYFPREQGADQQEQADVEQSRQRAEQVEGTYEIARTSYTTFVALARGLGLVTVSAQDSGNLVLTTQGQSTEYEEIEPWVWRQVGGHDLVAADTDSGTAGGGVRLSYMGPHTLVPAAATTRLLVPVLVVGGVLLAVVLVAWLAGALLRRRAVRAGRQTLPALSWTGRLARAGALLALVVTPGWLLVLTTMMQSLQVPSDLVLRAMQAAQWVSVAAIAPAAWDLYRAARSRPGWRTLTTASLLVVGLVALAWVAWSANLLTSGTRY